MASKKNSQQARYARAKKAAGALLNDEFSKQIPINEDARKAATTAKFNKKNLNAFNNAMKDKRRKDSLGASKVLNDKSPAGVKLMAKAGERYRAGTSKGSTKGNSVNRGGKGK